jgi:hypothetical protein
MKTKLYQPVAFILCISSFFSGCSEEETVVAVNKLEAIAGDDQEVLVNNLVILDGSASKDGNANPFTYLWTIKAKPNNSTATLVNETTATSEFTADQPGLYTVELKISQGQFFKTDFVTIFAKSNSDEPSTITLQENISADRTLTDIYEDPAKPDYLVTNDITISAKLTVSPGVVIEFDHDRSLQVISGGTLIAKGTSANRITFTGRVREKGYWKGISITSNSPDNEFDNVSVEYGGSNPLPDMVTIKANLGLAGDDISGGALKISNTSFHESAGYGMYVDGKSQLNYFSANYFVNNTASALYVPVEQLHKLDFFTHYTGNNGFNGVETGGTIQENAEVSWSYFNDGSKYLVTRDIIIKSGVRINEGAAFELANDVMIKVVDNGYLNASGSDFKPISFTAQFKTEKKFWKGFLFSSNSDLNALNNVSVSYAGFSDMPELNVKANVAVKAGGKLSVTGSTLEHGLGWGIYADDGSQVNANIPSVNFFDSFTAGYYKLPFVEPETTLTGEWVDTWSFQHEHYTIDDNFYNSGNGTWFAGATDPWHISPQTGFGLRINDDGSYLWTIAEQSPVNGECSSYSAEYITGSLQSTSDQITFNEDYWKSKFYTSCDPSQNADIEVEPGSMTLRYEINRMYNMFTGESYWELKIINPDNSFFTYYKK